MPTTTPTELALMHGDRGLAVYALTADGVRNLGRYRSAADAWRAVDAVDAPERADLREH